MSYEEFVRLAIESIADDLAKREIFLLDAESDEAWGVFARLLNHDSSLQVGLWHQSYGAAFQAQFAGYWHGFQYLVAERLGYV